MKTELNKVEHFMTTFEQPVRYSPIDELSENEKLLRVALLIEEVDELATALHVKVSPSGNLSCDTPTLSKLEALDALVDIAYVLFGTVHTLGFGPIFTDAFNEVHSSNMSKLDEDGKPFYHFVTKKVLKGPNYRKPDLASLLLTPPTNVFSK